MSPKLSAWAAGHLPRVHELTYWTARLADHARFHSGLPGPLDPPPHP